MTRFIAGFYCTDFRQKKNLEFLLSVGVGGSREGEGWFLGPGVSGVTNVGAATTSIRKKKTKRKQLENILKY